MLKYLKFYYSTTIKNENDQKSKKNLKKMILNNHGYVKTLSSGIITAKGLNNVASGELVKIWPSGIYAIALNLTNSGVGLVLCGSDTVVNTGNLLARTGSLFQFLLVLKVLV